MNSFDRKIKLDCAICNKPFKVGDQIHIHEEIGAHVECVRKEEAKRCGENEKNRSRLLN